MNHIWVKLFFHLTQIINVHYIFLPITGLNCEHLESEATTLPTEPQPLLFRVRVLCIIAQAELIIAMH